MEWTDWSRGFLLLTLRRFSHVNCCVSCACDSYSSAAYLLVDILLDGHHKLRNKAVHLALPLSQQPVHLLVCTLQQMAVKDRNTGASSISLTEEILSPLCLVCHTCSWKFRKSAAGQPVVRVREGRRGRSRAPVPVPTIQTNDKESPYCSLAPRVREH